MKSQKPLSKKGRIRSLVSRRSQWLRELQRLWDKRLTNWETTYDQGIKEINAIANELKELRK